MVTLPGGFPNVFSGLVYMQGRVTLGNGGTLFACSGHPSRRVDIFVCLSHVNAQGRVTLLEGSNLGRSDYCYMASHGYKPGEIFR